MRKLIFLLLLLLIATPVFAQQQEARMSLGVIGGAVPVAAGGSESGGDLDTESIDKALSGGAVKYCSNVFVPVHSGTASTFSIYGTNTDATTDIKIAIYQDELYHENTPWDLIGTLTVSDVATFSATWKVIDISSASIPITAGKNTYVCFQINAATITGKHKDSGGPMFYLVDAYANDFADNTGFNIDADLFSMYLTWTW